MSSILATVEQHAATALFARILDAPKRLVTLAHADSHALLEQWRVMARHSGQSIYLWRSGSGMNSLRDAHAGVPNCERLGDVLRYIQQSPHFGVYLLQGVELPLAPIDLAALRQIGRTTTAHLQRIVVLDATPGLIEQLGDLAMELSLGEQDTQRPRLRDGRWLL